MNENDVIMFGRKMVFCKNWSYVSIVYDIEYMFYIEGKNLYVDNICFIKCFCCIFCIFGILEFYKGKVWWVFSNLNIFDWFIF